jgi:hypothetical protein
MLGANNSTPDAVLQVVRNEDGRSLLKTVVKIKLAFALKNRYDNSILMREEKDHVLP